MARDIADIDLGEMARENVRNNEKSTNCPTVPVSQNKYNNNKKIYNYLYINKLNKNTKFTGTDGTVGHLGHFDYNTPTGYTFSDKLQAEDLPPLLARITELHADVVGRVTIGESHVSLSAANALPSTVNRPKDDVRSTDLRSAIKRVAERKPV